MTEEFKSYRVQSRTTDWGKNGEADKALTREELQFGCMLRIADATEAMAKNHVKLMEERDSFSRLYKQEKACSRRLARSNAALRGVISRLKRCAATESGGTQ